jgi:hypothetical protein
MLPEQFFHEMAHAGEHVTSRAPAVRSFAKPEPDDEKRHGQQSQIEYPGFLDPSSDPQQASP